MSTIAGSSGIRNLKKNFTAKNIVEIVKKVDCWSSGLTESLVYAMRPALKKTARKEMVSNITNQDPNDFALFGIGRCEKRQILNLSTYISAMLLTKAIRNDAGKASPNSVKNPY